MACKRSTVRSRLAPPSLTVPSPLSDESPGARALRGRGGGLGLPYASSGTPEKIAPSGRPPSSASALDGPEMGQASMSTSTLTEQVAVVTGASSGIGLAVARELRALGLRLVLTARSDDRLNEISGELGAATLAADITGSTVPEGLLATALARYGRCDVVVNNAGAIEVGPIESIDIDKVCSMVRVNVEAAYRVAYTFIRHFVEQGFGHVINASSVMGTKVRPTAGVYSGTKFAIEALSEALRMEVAGT